MDVPIDDFAALRLRHADEVAFIMGNGPSLRETPLKLLDDQIVFGGNAGYLIYDRVQWRHRYMTFADTKFITRCSTKIRQLAAENPGMDVFLPAWVQHWEKGGVAEATERYVPRGGNVHHYRPLIHSDIHLPFSAVSNNMNAGLVRPFTVTINMIEMAVWMGFKMIVLVGCDTSYGSSPAAARGTSRDTSTTHFSSDYPVGPSGLGDPRTDRMHWHYAQAHRAFNAYGVTIVNSTVGGELEVFPRIALEAVIDATTV